LLAATQLIRQLDISCAAANDADEGHSQRPPDAGRLIAALAGWSLILAYDTVFIY